MADYHADQEQIEELRNWWHDNGAFVIAGLVVGILAVGSYWGWQNYTTNRAEFASASYESLLEAVQLSDRDRALELGRDLRENYSATPYAAQGALALAKFHMQSEEPEEAADQLQAVVEVTKDPQLVLVARLRQARIRLDQGRPEDALALLDDVDPGTFAARYHEVRGDVHIAIGDTDAARLEYIAAMATFQDNVVDRPTLQMKLDELAMGEAPKENTGAETVSDQADVETLEEGEPES